MKTYSLADELHFLSLRLQLAPVSALRVIFLQQPVQVLPVLVAPVRLLRPIR